MPGVEDFPDLIQLRDELGEVTGLFSDHGAWFGVTWGERANFEIHLRPAEAGARRALLHLGAPFRGRTVWADALEGDLLDGAHLRLGFVSPDALVVEVRHDREPRVGCDLPFSVVAAGEGRWLVVVAPEGGAVRDPDCLDANRTRWDEMFRRAFHGLRLAGEAAAELAVARAVTVLGWNRRAPRGDLAHHGVIPSPFAYPGYWAWDSWKHAHALATVEPWLAAEQLRAQFQRQDRDGQVPDTCMPQRSRDHWDNTKPPMAAWALEALWRQTEDRALLAELYPPCARQFVWWDRFRRRPGEALHAAGGVDRRTAMWDSGWDDSRRFEEAPLEKGPGGWRLFRLWQPDLNTWLLGEARILARLARVLDQDPAPFEADARRLEEGLRRLLDPDTGLWRDRLVEEDGSPGPFARLSSACWHPYWAGLGGEAEGRALLEALEDGRRFGTPLPFPALPRDDPGFDPDGYWNGAVWFDQAALAVAALERLETGAGEEPLRRLLSAAADHPNLYENYSPLTGAPAQGARPAAPQFSWTAAAILEMARGGPTPFA